MIPKEPRNILVIRLSSIGDILLATPLLRVARRRFPDARIDLVVKKAYADLVRTNPHITTLYTLDPASGKEGLARLGRVIAAVPYDLVVDIHHNFRSHLLRRYARNALVVTVKKYYLKRFLLVKTGWNLYRDIIPVYRRYIDTLSPWGVKDDGEGLEFQVDAAGVAEAEALLGPAVVEERWIGFAPGAGFATKRWPGEYYLNLARRVQRDLHTRIALFGGSGDAAITANIAAELNAGVSDLAGQLSLMGTAAALQRCALLVTNDTGLMHLASALNVPTIALFGPTTRELGFFPFGPHMEVVENSGLSCRPCTHMGNHACPKKHFKCMREITPDRVYEQLLKKITDAESG